MGCLLRLITVMFLVAGAGLWLVFLGQIYEKIVHPHQKNLNWEEFFLFGLVLGLCSFLGYVGFRSKAIRKRNFR